MTPRTQQRAIAGGLIWIALIAAIIFVIRSVSNTAPDAIKELATYASHQQQAIELDTDLSLSALKPGDPIYTDGSDDAKPIGMVWSSKVQDSGATKVRVVMYANCPVISSQDHFVYREAADSFDWMLRTMFNDDKKAELKDLIQNAIKDNQTELVEAFKPVVVNSLKDANVLVRDDLRKAFEARKPQLTKLSQRYQTDVLEKKLMPVFQSEVWPIIQTESEPLVSEISREIWSEVSVFGFGWRYLYDRTPLPKKDLTEKKFKEFVDEKAKPIIAAHLDEVLELQKDIVGKVAKNEKVKKALNESVQAATSDPELQKFLADILQDVLINNPRLQESMNKQWSSVEARQAFSIANAKLDPVVREIGVSLFGTPDGGITSEFASVLRRRILHKDARWLTLKIVDPAANAALGPNQPMPTELPLRISLKHSTAPINLKRSAE